MRKIIVLTAAICIAGSVHAQSTTNCNAVGSAVRCTTSPDAAWQNQQNLNQAAANLGAAIAARRERKRQERAEASIKAAEASDTPSQTPPPADETPVVLACTMQGRPISLALYEKNARVDATGPDGIMRTRSASFSSALVTWTSPTARYSLSRLDGTFAAEGAIPAMAGQRAAGTCAVATERKF